MGEVSERGPEGYGTATFCGAGATSRVFRATEMSSGRVVALKRLHKSLVRDPKALARLKRELDALRMLRHEVIVQVSDVVIWNGDPTLVMDFIEGEDLKEKIEKSGKLDAQQTESIARALFDALSLAHGSGIVHRDIKPQNIRLAANGRVYLLDFGSARLDASSQLTATGTTVGTPEYMAPELFAGPVYDPRVDIYGVGATLYECLAGHPPHVADSLAELARLRTTVAPLPIAANAPDVSPALAAVIDRCLARAPEDRFASASLAVWALEHPEAERELAARRAKHPLCLHCGAAIPRESATCPSCAVAHPFRYSSGHCHVDIRSVENVGRFLEHVAIRFPERSTPEELELLAERAAALSFGPQRYVSFVSDRDADRIVADLGAAGVRANIVREPSWWSNVLLGLALPPYLPARIPFMLLKGMGSILSGSPVPRPVAPRVTEIASYTMVFSFMALVVCAFSDSPMSALYPWLSALGAIMITSGVALMTSLLISLRRPTTTSSAQPVANVAELAFATPSERKRRGAAPPWMLVATLIPLAIEVGGIALVQRAMRSVDPVSERDPTDSPGPVGFVTVAKPTGYVSVSPLSTAESAIVPVAEESEAREILTALLAGATIALLLAAMATRRSRIRRDAATIMSELDLPAFAKIAERPSPDRAGVTAGNALTSLRTNDVFAQRAIRRAAELMPLLAKAQAARLAASIEALVRSTEGHVAEGRSLASRSILEADPKQKLRFDLLAIEGQLEAQAAAEWLAQREGETLAAEAELLVEVEEETKPPPMRMTVD